ncbi:hypothetical protein ABKN59_003773 [Abortiporus biennis]
MTVLWPNDIRLSTPGFCFGWLKPLICIVGTIEAESEDDAMLILRKAIQEPSWQAAGSTLASPDIIGSRPPAGPNAEYPYIKFNENIDIKETQRVVYYHRPNLRLMEIYALDFSIYDLPQQEKPSDTPLILDPTMPKRPSSHLGPIVLKQMNFGVLLQQIVQKITQAEQKTSFQAKMQDFSLKLPNLSNFPWLKLNENFSTTVMGVPRLLSTISVSGNQLNDRLEQLIRLPVDFPNPYTYSVRVSSSSVSRYVNYWNDVWLILNDIIIGTAFGSFLCENAELIGIIIAEYAQLGLIDFPQHTLQWLNSWPAGLKLNTELSQFYCHSLLGIVEAWGVILSAFILPYLPALLYFIGTMGMCGLTMITSLFSDALSIFTIHLYVCYRISGFIFNRQLYIIGSLWNLFRGKRYNILRRRKDSWDYDIDQLLLGTILFTLVAFLSPTSIAYYSLFALTRFMIVLVHALLDTVLVLMNHFPLFALLLRTKNPHRMPGGILFKLSKQSLPVIEIRPLPYSRVFDLYVHLGSQLFSHYHPLRLMRLILRGNPLTTIPRPLIRLRSKRKDIITTEEDKQE